jgi:hypothetical protein
MRDEVTSGRLLRGASALLSLFLVASAWGAEDPTLRAVQQNQLQRQHQQDQLQLRMQQYQSSTRYPPQDTRERQALEQLEMSQALRQQQLQLQQQRDFQVRPEASGDDEGVRRAKAQIEQTRARQEAQRQLQQFDRELQSKAAGGRRNAEGAVQLQAPLMGGTGLLPPGLPPPTVQPLPRE